VPRGFRGCEFPEDDYERPWYHSRCNQERGKRLSIAKEILYLARGLPLPHYDPSRLYELQLRQKFALLARHPEFPLLLLA
jgi:PIN domain nuclease of toxin-antitoxin system